MGKVCCLSNNIVYIKSVECNNSRRRCRNF